MVRVLAQVDHLVSYLRPAYVVRTTESPPRKPIDTAKWLNKVSFVTVEFRVLVKVITQPSLSAMFGSRVPVYTVPNTPKDRPQAKELTDENIVNTFASLGYTRETFVQGHPEHFETFVEDVKAAAKKSMSIISISLPDYLYNTIRSL